MRACFGRRWIGVHGRQVWLYAARLMPLSHSTFCCAEPCLRSFHVECLGLETLPDDDEWFCSGCVANQHACYSGKKEGLASASNLNSAEQIVLRCQGLSCGKFYHESCLKQLPLTRMETLRAASGRSLRFVCPVSKAASLCACPVSSLLVLLCRTASYKPPLPHQPDRGSRTGGAGRNREVHPKLDRLSSGRLC